MEEVSTPGTLGSMQSDSLSQWPGTGEALEKSERTNSESHASRSKPAVIAVWHALASGETKQLFEIKEGRLSSGNLV